MILHKGEVLFHQGERGDLYRLKRGVIKTVRLQEDGTSVLFNLLVPGEIFPHHSLISPQPYFASAVAVTTCEVERIPAHDWYRRLEEHPETYRDVAMILQDTLRRIQRRIELTTAPTSRRLSLLRNWLSSYCPGLAVEDLLTQEEIGQLVGLSRETVNRLMRKKRG